MSRRYTLWGLVLVTLVILAAVFLLAYPPKVHARTSPYVITHHDNYGAARREQAQSAISSRALRDARENERQAQRNVERAKSDVYRAYIPRGPQYAPSRNADILRAESNLDRAKSDLRAMDNRLYSLERKIESNNRDAKLQREYKRLLKKRNDLAARHQQAIKIERSSNLHKNPASPRD